MNIRTEARAKPFDTSSSIDDDDDDDHHRRGVVFVATAGVNSERSRDASVDGTNKQTSKRKGGEGEKKGGKTSAEHTHAHTHTHTQNIYIYL